MIDFVWRFSIIWGEFVTFCVCVIFYGKGRRERGLASSGCGSSRRLRIPKHSAGTLWLRTVAPPCPLPAVRRKLSVPLGCAPGCFAEYQAILNILPKPPPECTHPLSRLFFASAAKRARYGLFAVVLERILSDLRFPRNYFVQVLHVKQPRICFIIGLILFMVDKPNHIALVS